MIAIFGANGFIGKHVTHLFAESGFDVTAVAREGSPAVEHRNVRYLQGDLRALSAMRQALEGIQTVVQLMGTSTPAQGNTRSTQHINNDVIPHVDFLNECVAAGVKRIVFASSGGTVYGPASHVALTPESAPTNPISSHGVTKLMVEHFIKLHGHLDGLEYVILRIANPYGPGQVFKNGQGLIPALMERYERKLPVTIYGDGRASRDYVYIGDVARAFQAAVEAQGSPNLVLNVGSGIRRTVLEVVRAIEQAAGITFKIEHAPARQADVSSIALETSRIHEELDWRPYIDFPTGLRRTLGLTDITFGSGGVGAPRSISGPVAQPGLRH